MKSDIHIKRAGGHTLRAALGEIFLGGGIKRFCYSLEDCVRGKGVKIAGETAIPEGEYFWHITRSSRFKRDMISIYTESNGYEIINGGISFKGVRIHGGNTIKDTHGCPLVAYNKLSNISIQGTAEKDLLAWW